MLAYAKEVGKFMHTQVRTQRWRTLHHETEFEREFNGFVVHREESEKNSL